MLLCSPATRAQITNEGRWLSPFNHVVPSTWVHQTGTYAGKTKDGEPTSPYTSGQNPHRFLAAHMALIPVGPRRGEVLVWNYMRPNQPSFAAGHYKQYWSIMKPSTPPAFSNFVLTLPTIPGNTYNSQDLFCAGHSWNSRGELFVAGSDRYLTNRSGPIKGLRASSLTFTFDPQWAPVGNGMWRQEQDLATPRWYPTVTTMATDSSTTGGIKDMLMVSGGLDATTLLSKKTYEVFDPQATAGAGAFQSNPAQPLPYPGFPKIFAGPAVAAQWEYSIYPRNHLLSSGKIFTSGMNDKSYRVKHDAITQLNPPLWEVMALASQPFSREYGSSVLFPNLGGSNGGFQDLILRIGGHLLIGTGGVATNTVEYCDAGLGQNDPSWKWQFTASMAFPRANLNSVLLPDGTILAVGGKTDVTNEFLTGQPVQQTELFNETPFAWRTLAPMETRRGYHSTAILMPDGSVLVGGGEQREWDYEVFQPPYMTNGTIRPTILNPPSTLQLSYGQGSFLTYKALPMGVYIEKVVLMAPASLTHHSDMHARYVELDIDHDILPTDPPPANPSIYFNAPASSKLAPKGYYMIFLVTNGQGLPKGTPSSAAWVKLQ